MRAPDDLFQPGDSWLHRLDPRTKLLMALCSLVLLLSFANLWLLLGALLGAHLLYASGRIRIERIAWLWQVAWLPMFLVALFWVLFHRGGTSVLVAWLWLRISTEGLATGLAMAARIGALTFAISLWLSATSQTSLVQGLVALGLPYEWGLTLAMALRYVPTMASTFRMIGDAQRARALDLDQGTILRRARAHLPIIVAMVITSLRAAESLSYALQSRALGAPGGRRSQLHPLCWHAADGLAVAATLAGTATLLVARHLYGLGAQPLYLLP